MKFEQMPPRAEKNAFLNESSRAALQRKLVEYEHRMNKYKSDHVPVESQMDTICKKRILEHILENGNISTDDFWSLRQRLAERYAGDFNADAFDNAFNVIKDYAENAGEGTVGGTGLDKKAA